MKIEKVNEHQIRCTLTREDLLNRELKISELAYGTEKAKSLFRDMMQQAAYECGFEAEDIPLMIEAIPLNAECIVLIVTKVEDPEELDTRFSKFAPSVHDEESFSDETEALMDSFADGADEVLNMLRKMNSSSADVSAPQSGAPASKASASKNNKDASSVKITSRLFSFSSLRDVTRLARVISTSYQDANSLYEDDSSGRYLLLLFMEKSSSRALMTGMQFLWILSPFYFVVSAKLVADGILRGTSAMGQFMVATFTDLILRVVLSFLLSGWTGSALGIWCSWPVGWTIATGMSLFFYRRACRRLGACTAEGRHQRGAVERQRGHPVGNP